MMRLNNKVVVLTGASSGLGRETALQLARKGARLALAGRRKEALEVTARECHRAGGTAIVVVTDVTREADVQNLMQATLAEWGELDVWINNAGVTLFGLLADVPFEEHRRVIETNLFGAMYGARAAIPFFKRQEHGVLINVGSVVSKIGQPYVPSYAISKFGVRGLTETLRAEVAELPNVHVCSFLPYAINTPHFESGANHVGTRARAMPPMLEPDDVARRLVRLVEHPRREMIVPRVASLGLALHSLFPRMVERLMLRALRRWHFEPRTERLPAGNLRTPSPTPATVRGRRPALIRTPAFVAWVLGEFVKMEVQSLAR